jgi:preprotein translocase subunit SecE
MSQESKDHSEKEQRRRADKDGAATHERRRRTSPAQFLREVRSELRKVAWPDRREVTSYTVVVLVTTLVLTLIVWGMDQVVRNAVINTLG